MQLSAKLKKNSVHGVQSHLKFSKIEKMQALKMGYFYWLHVKNHLYTELSLGYP